MVNRILNSIFTSPPLFLADCSQGGCMNNMFKDGETWRHNQPSRVACFFDCRLKSLLDARPDLNATKLAALLDKSPTTVSDWVHGREIPPDDIQEMIAQIFERKNRAEIWRWKGPKIAKYILVMNKLNRELKHTREMMKRVMQKPCRACQ
jgi:hypothetical protein